MTDLKDNPDTNNQGVTGKDAHFIGAYADANGSAAENVEQPDIPAYDVTRPVSDWSDNDLENYVQDNGLDKIVPEAMSGLQREVVQAWGAIASRRRHLAERQAERATQQNVYDAVVIEKKRQAVVSYLDTQLAIAHGKFRTGQATVEDDFTLTIEHGGVSTRLSLAEMKQVINTTSGNFLLLLTMMREAMKLRHKTSDRQCQNLCTLGQTRYPYHSQVTPGQFLPEVTPELAEEVL